MLWIVQYPPAGRVPLGGWLGGPSLLHLCQNRPRRGQRSVKQKGEWALECAGVAFLGWMAEEFGTQLCSGARYMANIL
jgi:hypothetical protein